MKTLFMVDIESTGVNIFSDDILQVCVLALHRNKRGYWLPETPAARAKATRPAFLELPGLTDKKPLGEFASKHTAHLYHRAWANVDAMKKLGRGSSVDVAGLAREKILAFVKAHTSGAAKRPVFIGWRATQFDLPMLWRHGWLKQPGYEAGPDGKETEVGDHDYRTVELAGMLDLMRYSSSHVLSDGKKDFNYKALSRAAAELCPEITLPEGRGEHDAVYDCYYQAKIFNGLIRMQRL